jgi:beta-alanine degradation protein BauB
MQTKRPILALGLALTLATAWPFLRAQSTDQETDAVKITPHMYKVRLENPYIRVLEYRCEPGEKEPMHFHPPGVVYSFSDAVARITDREGHTEDRQLEAGEVSWRNKTWHAAENTGKTEIHVLAIELKMPLKDLN